MSMSRSLAAFGVAFVLSILFGAPQTAQAREVVAFSGYSPGTIVVKTGERRLYLVTDSGRETSFTVIHT